MIDLSMAKWVQLKKIATYQTTSKPSVIYVKFDDLQAGIKTIQKCTDNYAREHSVVPIQRVLARIKLRPGKSSSPEIQKTTVSYHTGMGMHSTQSSGINRK